MKDYSLLLMCVISALVLIIALFYVHKSPFNRKSPFELCKRAKTENGIDLFIVRFKGDIPRDWATIEEMLAQWGLTSGEAEDRVYASRNKELPKGITLYFRSSGVTLAIHTEPRLPHCEEKCPFDLKTLPGDRYSFLAVIKAKYARQRKEKTTLNFASQ